MSAMQPWIPGARVLDLFAGSGALGLETLSRGASRVTFVEKGRAALQALRQNIATLGAASDAVEVVRGDAIAYVRELERDAFDLALADPPYRRGFAQALLARYQERPFAAALWIEHASDDALALPDGARTRRYGDTALSRITPDARPSTAPDDTHPTAE